VVIFVAPDLGTEMYYTMRGHCISG